jgi:hypothetical protein
MTNGQSWEIRVKEQRKKGKTKKEKTKKRKNKKSNCGRPPQPKGWGMQGPPAVILELFSVL